MTTTKEQVNMTGKQEVITNEQFMPILTDSMVAYEGYIRKNPHFKVQQAEKTLVDKVCYIENEKYVILRFQNKKKFLMKDDKGTIRNYLWDKKDKIYKTKKGDRIVVPNMCCCIDNESCAEYYKKYGIFGEGDKQFHVSALNNRAENHTGNHNRNNFVKVPPKAIGR